MATVTYRQMLAIAVLGASSNAKHVMALANSMTMLSLQFLMAAMTMTTMRTVSIVV